MWISRRLGLDISFWTREKNWGMGTGWHRFSPHLLSQIKSGHTLLYRDRLLKCEVNHFPYEVVRWWGNGEWGNEGNVIKWLKFLWGWRFQLLLFPDLKNCLAFMQQFPPAPEKPPSPTHSQGRLVAGTNVTKAGTGCLGSLKEPGCIWKRTASTSRDNGINPTAGLFYTFPKPV